MKKLLFASTVIENREDQLAVLYEEIEQDLKVALTNLRLHPEVIEATQLPQTDSCPGSSF